MSGGATIFGAGGGVNYGTDGSGTAQQILSDAQALRVSLAAKKTLAGDTVLKVLSQVAAGNNGDEILPVGPMGFNGTLFEPLDNNREILVLPSAVRSATTFSATQTNKNGRGLVIALLISVDPGGGDTVRPYFVITGVNGILDYVLPIDIARGGAGSLTQWTYWIAPEATTAGGIFDAALAIPVPRSWSLRMIHSAGSNFTYAVSAVQVL